jgi:hypothetical protein
MTRPSPIFGALAAQGARLAVSTMPTTSSSIPTTPWAQRTAEIVYSLAGGVAVDPRSFAVGPQLSFAIAGRYLRSAYLFDQGLELSFGLALKLPALISWSD